MKKFPSLGVFVFGLVLALSGIAIANQVSTPNLPLASPAPIQNGDLIVMTRNGITQNASWPPSVFPSGAVNLGSITTANPAISGDLTSGFYTSGAARVDVGISGVNVTEWSPSGLGFPTTSSAAAGFTGIHSPSANAIALSTTGTDRFIIDSTGAITTGLWRGTAVATGYGGTGLTSTPTNGQIDIGNGSGFTRTTITQGSGITITNGAGSITIAATGGSSQVNLGSLTTANPQISGDVTSGFYSAGAGEVDVSVSGANAAKFTSGGSQLANTTTVNNLTINGTCIGCGGGSLIGVTTTGATALGTNALHSLTTGLDNVAIGYNAGASILTDSGTIFIGSGAGQNFAIGNTTTLGANTGIGFNSLNATITSAKNTAVGYRTLATTVGGTGENTAIGYNAGRLLTTGAQNVFIGANAGNVCTTCTQNVYIGDNVATSGGAAGTGSTIVGYGSGSSPNNGQITIFGAGSGTGGMGINNVILGNSSGTNIGSGTQNIAIGSVTMAATAVSSITGGDNIALGTLAFNHAQSGAAQNVGIGTSAFAALTTGTANTSLGYQSGTKITTGANNVVLGYQVGSTTLTIGSRNILIGTSNAIDATTTSQSDSINIQGIWTVTGTNTPSTAANTINGTIALPNIGTDATHTTATLCEDTTTHIVYFGSGTAGICLGTSSARYKNDIKPLHDALADVMRLKPVEFYYKAGHGDTTKLQRGLLAEDLVNVFPDLVSKDKDGEPNTVDYGALPVILLKAVQEQQRQISDTREAAGLMPYDGDKIDFMPALIFAVVLEGLFIVLLWFRRSK